MHTVPLGRGDGHGLFGQPGGLAHRRGYISVKAKTSEGKANTSVLVQRVQWSGIP